MQSQIKHRFLSAITISVVLSLSLSQPSSLHAEKMEDRTSPRNPRFRIEVFGGYTGLNPSDLNQIVNYDISMQTFQYDSYFDYLQENELIQHWDKWDEGKRRKITNAFPFGIRFRYDISNFLSLTAGFQYFQKINSESIDFHYSRYELYNEDTTEILNYDPYELSVEAIRPFIGIHFCTHLGGKKNLEGFISGGPVFGRVSYTSNWHYTWQIQTYGWLVHEKFGLLKEKGSGTGISLELGGRMTVPLFWKLDMFLEGAYTYQKIKPLAGPGEEIQEGITETWSEEWKIREETVTAPWGTLIIEFPTNYRMEGAAVREFNLDLSGLSLRIGFSFRF